MTLLGLGLRCVITHAGCSLYPKIWRQLRISKCIDYIFTTVTSTKETFVGARGYLGRRYKKCTGKSSKRLIRWQRYLRRFKFLFAVRVLNEKSMQSTHVNLVFCAV